MVCRAECTRFLPHATLNPVEREPHLQRFVWYFLILRFYPTSYCTRCFRSWLQLETKVGQACGLVILTQISRQLWSCAVPERTRRSQPGDTSPRLVCAVQHVLLFLLVRAYSDRPVRAGAGAGGQGFHPQGRPPREVSGCCFSCSSFWPVDLYPDLETTGHTRHSLSCHFVGRL